MTPLVTLIPDRDGVAGQRVVPYRGAARLRCVLDACLGPQARAFFILPALGVPISEVGPSGVFDVSAHSARAYNLRKLWLRLRCSRIDVQATPRGRATAARLQIIVVE
jgi:hypothetical protein